jgi:hypothetical protein
MASMMPPNVCRKACSKAGYRLGSFLWPQDAKFAGTTEYCAVWLCRDSASGRLRSPKERLKRTERSLYQRAKGYSYDAVKIFMPANRAKPVYAKYIEHVPAPPLMSLRV